MDKFANLRHRIHRKAEAFDFSALIQGVSTLEDELETEATGDLEKGTKAKAGKGKARSAAPVLINPAPEMATPADEAPAPTEDAPAEPVSAAPVPEQAAPAAPEALRAPEKPAEQPLVLTPDPIAPVREPAPAVEPAARPAATAARNGDGAQSDPVLPLAFAPTPSAREERLRTALDALGCRLLPEIGMMSAAIQSGDAEEAGFYLAHVNQVLELLRSIDPTGDLARQLGAQNAPPDNRPWPATAWSVVEFAESPFSGLLPQGTTDAFVREMMYAAWGVSLETQPA